MEKYLWCVDVKIKTVFVVAVPAWMCEPQPRCTPVLYARVTQGVSYERPIVGRWIDRCLETEKAQSV